MRQTTLAESGCVKHRKITRKARFLAEMERMIPWDDLVKLIEVNYPNPQGAGRRPKGAGRMLRVHGIVFLISVGLGLSGCQTTPVYKAPTIVDIDDSKVVVQRQLRVPVGSFTLNSATINDVKNIAAEGCANYKGKESVLLSETCGLLGTSVFGEPFCVATNYLFACKDK